MGLLLVCRLSPGELLDTERERGREGGRGGEGGGEGGMGEGEGREGESYVRRGVSCGPPA